MKACGRAVASFQSEAVKIAQVAAVLRTACRTAQRTLGGALELSKPAGGTPRESRSHRANLGAGKSVARQEQPFRDRWNTSWADSLPQSKNNMVANDVSTRWCFFEKKSVELKLQ